MRLILVLTALYSYFLFSSCKENKASLHSEKNITLFPVDVVVSQNLRENVELLGQPKSVSVDVDRDSAIVHNYEKENFQMIVTYNSTTNKPLEVFITTVNKYYPENISDYYNVANVSTKDSSYTLVPYKSMNDLELFRGLSVLPRHESKNAK